MLKEMRVQRNPTCYLVSWGALWGIFEATVGYLLHLLPFSAGWLVWFPTACFFMGNAYRKTGSAVSVLFVGMLSASVKLLNLFLPGRIDRVINPAISIVCEALAMGAVLALMSKRPGRKRASTWVNALGALAINTSWRALYILYLLLLAPEWMREISVLRSMDSFLTFFLAQNLGSSAVAFFGWVFARILYKPVDAVERRLASLRGSPVLRVSVAVVLICASGALTLLL